MPKKQAGVPSEVITKTENVSAVLPPIAGPAPKTFAEYRSELSSAIAVETPKPEEGQTLQLISWPYSRNVVHAMCYISGRKYTHERISKLHEVFRFEESGPEFVNAIHVALRIVNAFAKEHGKESGGFSKSRNVLVADVLLDFKIPFLTNKQFEMTRDSGKSIVNPYVAN